MSYSDVYTLGSKNINFKLITYLIETMFDHSNMFGDHQPKNHVDFAESQHIYQPYK